MSTSVLPVLKGLQYPVSRKPMFKSSKPQSISGKETAIARWAYPRYQWTLSWSLLRQGTIQGVAFTEFQQLESFFETLKGGFDSWLYTDPNDNAVVNQAIGVGDGSTSNFQLPRAFGGVAIPVLAPNLSIAPVIKVNGSTIPGSGYNITAWGTTDPNGPGVLEFGSPPAGSAVITGSFSYYFPVRFDEDSMDFSLFTKQMYELSKTTFTSIK